LRLLRAAGQQGSEFDGDSQRHGRAGSSAARIGRVLGCAAFRSGS